MEEINIKRFFTNNTDVLLWDEIVEKYPKQCVILTDFVLDDCGNVVSGIVFASCSPEYVSDIMVYTAKLGKRCLNEMTYESDLNLVYITI